MQKLQATKFLKFDFSPRLWPIGLSVLKAYGFSNITAIDGNDSRLELAKELGAKKVYNFTKYKTLEELLEIVKLENSNQEQTFAFQCTGVTKLVTSIWKFIKCGGGLCEVGFFLDGGNAEYNPHLDMCQKEITVVGSWVYSAHEYPLTFNFLQTVKELKLPLNKLLTHKFKLEDITKAFETNISMKGIKIAIVNE